MTSCCDTCNTNGYSQQMHASAQCNHIPAQFIDTHMHAHCAIPLWLLARCIQAVWVRNDQLMAVCWPGHPMDPPAHATQLSTLEQATCFSNQTHTASLSIYLFGSFSCCVRNLYLHLQHRSRISTQTSMIWITHHTDIDSVVFTVCVIVLLLKKLLSWLKIHQCASGQTSLFHMKISFIISSKETFSLNLTPMKNLTRPKWHSIGLSNQSTIKSM